MPCPSLVGTKENSSVAFALFDLASLLPTTVSLCIIFPAHQLGVVFEDKAVIRHCVQGRGQIVLFWREEG
jgi:hypothetical protein